MGSFALDRHDQDFIERQLKSGRYDDASEVVSAGLRMLEAFEEQQEKWLRHDVAGRLQAHRNDPGRASSIEDVFDRLAKRHRER